MPSVSMMEYIPTLKRAMAKSKSATMELPTEDMDNFFDVDKYISDPTPDLLSSPTHHSPATSLDSDFATDGFDALLDVPMFDDAVGVDGQLFDQMPGIPTTVYGDEQVVMVAPSSPNGSTSYSMDSDDSSCFSSPATSLLSSPPAIVIKTEEPSEIAALAVPSDSLMVPMVAGQNVDLDKLNMMLAGAKLPDVQAMFPDLLPTVEKLKDMVMRQKGESVEGSDDVLELSARVKPVKPNKKLSSSPPAPVDPNSGLNIPWMAAAAAAAAAGGIPAITSSLMDASLIAAIQAQQNTNLPVQQRPLAPATTIVEPTVVPETPSNLSQLAALGLMPVPAATTTAQPTTISPHLTSVASPILSSDDAPRPNRPGRKRKPRPTDPEVIMQEVVAKRAKNTEAARRSRMRKVMRMEALEDRIRELEEENEALRRRAEGCSCACSGECGAV
ncbi:hypothetical protein HDV00_000379 [Rhizophlyctis rosea]|nr:hypothetical protein HDV00_000379 [Rhizophlyctis rosea]